MLRFFLVRSLLESLVNIVHVEPPDLVFTSLNQVGN